MRFEVPQFIEIEDKIFGPFTWRQFVYLGGGLGAAVVMFLYLPIIISLIIGIPLALLAGALAFYPINNRPFSFFLEAIWNYVTGTRMYLWRRKADVIYKDRAQRNDIDLPIGPANRATNHKSITSLTRSLELQALQKPGSGS